MAPVCPFVCSSKAVASGGNALGHPSDDQKGLKGCGKLASSRYKQSLNALSSEQSDGTRKGEVNSQLGATSALELHSFFFFSPCPRQEAADFPPRVGLPCADAGLARILHQIAENRTGEVVPKRTRKPRERNGQGLPSGPR